LQNIIFLKTLLLDTKSGQMLFYTRSYRVCNCSHTVSLTSAIGCVVCADDARRHAIKCQHFYVFSTFMSRAWSGLLTGGLMSGWPFVLEAD